MDAYLGLESGGTKLAAYLLSEDGQRITHTVFPRDPAADASATLTALESAARTLASRANDTGHTVRAAGFGFGGYVRRSTQSPALCLHEPGWESGGVRERLSTTLGLPVFVENDCKVAALAEAHQGAGAGHDTVFYVTLGTGVGGGIVHAGGIVALGDLGEAEIGHLVVEPAGPPCWCGGRGCVEALCSGPGIVQTTRWQAGLLPSAWHASPLASQSPLTSHAIVAAWKSGDPFAVHVRDTAAAALARALGSVATLINPGVIVIGGGFGLASPAFLGTVRDRFSAHVAPAFRGHAQLRPAALAESVVSLGAALLARGRHIAG